MLQELKKQSLKRVLPGVIVLALLAAVCMALGGAGVVNLVKGPDWLYDYYGEDLEGRYVEADVYVVYDWYAETTSRRDPGLRRIVSTTCSIWSTAPPPGRGHDRHW